MFSPTKFLNYGSTKKIDTGYFAYKNKDDPYDGVIRVSFNEGLGSITNDKSFHAFLDGLKTSKEYDGGLTTENIKIGSINAKKLYCKYIINDVHCSMVSVLFDCADGFGNISFVTYDKNQYSKDYDKIINSLVITKEPETTKETEESTTEETTTEATEATTEASTASEKDLEKIKKQAKKDFVKQCKTYDYRKLIRNESKYTGKPVAYRVKNSTGHEG